MRWQRRRAVWRRHATERLPGRSTLCGFEQRRCIINTNTNDPFYCRLRIRIPRMLYRQRPPACAIRQEHCRRSHDSGEMRRLLQQERLQLVRSRIQLRVLLRHKPGRPERSQPRECMRCQMQRRLIPEVRRCESSQRVQERSSRGANAAKLGLAQWLQVQIVLDRRCQ